MISRDDFDAYNRAVEAIAAEAEEAVAGSVLEWYRGHPDAAVAECRSYAIRCMEGMVQAYDEAAATLAAQWYDGVAEGEGASLRPAITSVTYSGKLVADTARYQARKLASGDVEGFAASCGELARNDALKSVNQTVIANCGRDRREGVRFARVPTGLETCTFCLMLASRGAVYHTRESAGEFSHYHRRCDCKVVPGFADDPMAELVEGRSPRDARNIWLGFRAIEREGLPRARESAVKAACLDAHGYWQDPARLADEFDAALRDAFKEFSKSKTIECYDSSVGRFLEMIGAQYGVSLSGERYANKNGRVVGAAPDGDELWAIARLRIGGRFVYARREFKSPDFDTGTEYLEIKTPKSARKMNSLLTDASRKFEMFHGPKNAVISLLRLPSAAPEAADAAERFMGDGTLDKVLVVKAK